MEEWTVIKILNWTIDYFKRKGLKNPKFDAEYLISNALGLNRLEIYLNFDMPVEKEKRDVIKTFILERGKHKPIQYILGQTEFYGLKLYVNENVLIPRPETERLVELILQEQNVNSILDIGTGSGAIAITLAKHLSDIKIIATDIDENAIYTARKNAKLHKIENIKFIQSNLFENIDEQFDIIVSNPPYISNDEYKKLDREIKDFEPKTALLAREDGLFFYREILWNAKTFLTKRGKIFFEIGYNQAQYIENIAKKSGFQNVVIKKDYNDYDRYMIIY